MDIGVQKALSMFFFFTGTKATNPCKLGNLLTGTDSFNLTYFTPVGTHVSPRLQGNGPVGHICKQYHECSIELLNFELFTASVAPDSACLSTGYTWIYSTGFNGT